MKNISLFLYTIFRGNFVGKDQDGNKYYKSNISHGIKKDRRWVLYKGDNDPTNIDPSWHAWLHHVVDDVPNYDYSTGFELVFKGLGSIDSQLRNHIEDNLPKYKVNLD